MIRRRWVVERTFAWIMKCRRLVRDYEQITRVAEALITVAAIATLVRRRIPSVTSVEALEVHRHVELMAEVGSRLNALPNFSAERLGLRIPPRLTPLQSG